MISYLIYPAHVILLLLITKHETLLFSDWFLAKGLFINSVYSTITVNNSNENFNRKLIFSFASSGVLQVNKNTSRIVVEP
jgi:hypothetical protein